MLPEIKAILTSAPLLFSSVDSSSIQETLYETQQKYSVEQFEAKMKDVDKIAEAIFFETRGTCQTDREAVAEVILQRVELNDYPKDVTKVVNQYTWKSGVKVCQFSYMCEPNVRYKKKLYREEPYEWEKARRTAFNAVMFGPTSHTNGADHYFAHKIVQPSWYKRKAVTKKTCAHTYLKLAKG